jgi:chromosome segregation and condensation protein ScpB
MVWLQVETAKELLAISWEKVTVVGILLAVIFGLVYDRKSLTKNQKSELDKKEEEIRGNLKEIARIQELRMQDIKEFSANDAERTAKLEKLSQSVITVLEIVKNSYQNGRS